MTEYRNRKRLEGANCNNAPKKQMPNDSLITENAKLREIEHHKLVIVVLHIRDSTGKV
jgi:hypothetical protein